MHENVSNHHTLKIPRPAEAVRSVLTAQVQIPLNRVVAGSERWGVGRGGAIGAHAALETETASRFRKRPGPL